MAASHLSLKRWYNFYNKKYFNDELPQDTELIWSPLPHDNANTDGKTIWMDPSLRFFPKFMRITLLHEMCHVRRPKATHGKVFQREIDRLYALGAFRPLL